MDAGGGRSLHHADRIRQFCHYTSAKQETAAPLTLRLVLASAHIRHQGQSYVSSRLEEIAAPYYVFKEAGYGVDIASTSGGKIPMDEASLSSDFLTEAAKKMQVRTSVSAHFSAAHRRRCAVRGSI